MKSLFYLKSRMAIVYMAVMFSLLVVSSFAQTGLLREYWSGISGAAVSNLTGSTAYPNTPTSRDIISLFEGPTNLADNYGTRIRGYVVPPTTGSYTFWIASDDNSELWISTNDDPANKTLIASVTGFTGSREWAKYASQQSTARTLTAGQKYYIEALHKEGTGGDNLAVGWQGPGITGDAERPIPGSRLVPYELGLLREVWTSVSGTAVSNLTSNANYPNTPNVSETVYSFETTTNYADNYGQRLRGYVVPPTTGSYTFWIASDDNAELWLGTGADPAGKALVASVTGYTNSREWTKFSSQQSTARTLTAGQKYYIEVLHKEGTGGDNLAVGWQGPGITGDAERPIPSSRLLKWTGGNQTYSLTMSNDGHGTTTPSGTVTVNSGAATAISATPLGGYQFSGWSVTSGTATIANTSSASTTVTLSSGNATVQANFAAITYTLTMSNDGHGTTTPSSGTVTVNSGAATAISATPSSGYQFSGWSVTSGTATIANASSASTTVTLSSGNATIQANFTAITYTLTMSNDGHGTTTPSGTVTVNSGAATAISATPLGGYQFSGWSVTSGTATIANASSASTTVTLSSGNATIRANFAAITYTLTMSNDGHGTTTPSGTVTVNSGAATPISATPLGGYQFSGWSVTSGTATIANASSASTTVTLSSGNATIRANFAAITYTLTMSNDGHGTTTPSGTVTVNSGAATAISATPSSGYQFSNWTVTSGTATIANPSSASTTVALTSGNATVRANFTNLTSLLTVIINGNGTTVPSGSVWVSPGVVTPVTAYPANNEQFLNWTVVSGVATIANPSSANTTVTIASGNATIQANFVQFDTLTVSNNGNGSTVPSGPLAVGRGVAATISASANIGYHFSGWTVLSGTATIANPAAASTTVTLTAGNAAIRANFAQDLPVIPNNRQIAISGTLSDENGNPVGSSSPEAVEMAVRLCSQAVGGDTLYTEEFLARNNQAVAVDKGIFVARLGTGAASADLRTVVAANENLFAEITILGAQPDVLLPRTPVTAAPYSLGMTPAAALQDKTLHGQGNPADLSIDAAIGSYYVNDTDGTTWVKINNGWRRMD